MEDPGGGKGGMEQQQLCAPGSSWRGRATDSAILSVRTAGFGQAFVKILADCGISGDDATQARKVFHCTEVGAIDADVRRTVVSCGGDWYNTSVFFRLMVRLTFLAASKKRLTMSCRASSVWARRAQLSANSSSVMS